MPSPDRPLRETRIVVFDTETTGLSPLRDRIVEIAALSLENGRETGRFEELVDPAIPIPPELTKLHGIDDSMVRGKPLIAEVAARFLEFAGDACLAAHNAPYDMAMLLRPAFQSGLAPAGNPVLDTCRLARRLVDAPNYQLGTLAGMLGVDLSRAHRAMPDVEATSGVLLECIRRLGDEASLAGAEKASAARLSFGGGAPDGRELPLRLEAMDAAMRSGAPVEIVYRGGSHGDAPRTITPIFLLELDRLLNVAAVCHIDDCLKNFRVAQIAKARPAGAC